MSRAAVEIENFLPATLTAPGLSEAEFLELCAKFPDAMVEYTADGRVIVTPPTDPESGARVNRVAKHLTNWSDDEGGGIVCGPDSGFRFRDGSRRSPDAAWFSAKRWREAKKSGERFPVFAPEFVIEVRSPDDRLSELTAKMEEYMANGVQLGWLIDPMKRTVRIYRKGRKPKLLENPAEVAGEGPVAGFVLKLAGIFEN